MKVDPKLKREAHDLLNQLKTHAPLWVSIIKEYIRQLEAR